MKLTARFALISLALLAHAGALHAQTYPARPVRIIVGYTAGGATDVTARIVAQKLGETWGQQVVVDNRPGASGTIGAELAAKAPPDGYTLLVSPQTSVVTAPLILRKVNFDTLKDLAPLSIIGSTPLLLAIHPSLPPRNFKEFAAFTRAHAAKLAYATGGIGSTPHLASELLNLSLGVRLVHIPYKGEAPGIADLVGGQVPMMFANLPVILPHVKAGKLRALAISSPERSPLAPEYPTLAESGMPAFDIATWNGLYAPAALPRDLGARLSGDVARAVQAPEVKERMVKQGIDPVGSMPDDHVARVKSEFVRIGRIVREAGIRGE